MKQFCCKSFLLLITYSLVLLVRLSLWLRPAQTVSFLGCHSLSPLEKVKMVYPVSSLVWAVERSSALPLGQMKCLGRALVTQTLMLLSGHTSKVCFGVAKEPHNQIEAHAWVEYQGRIIIGQLNNMSRFYPLSTWMMAEK